ncbi:MAG: PEGA domain-containing protein [Bacteroidota bacterium]
MRKILFLLLLLAFSMALFAQPAVKSFRRLPNDMDARVAAPLTDQNGDICAIIKVVTTQTGFSFDCGLVGIVKTLQKTSEIWVYVPYGAKRISISHPQLGFMRDYMFPQPIEKATVYELVLISGTVVTTVQETIVSQWLVITPEPPDAMVYLNEKFVKNGTYQAKLKPGSYTYRVEAPKYYTEAGKIEITDAKTEVNAILKPAFGFLLITTEPEPGAKVIVDGETLDETSPCKSSPLASGSHTVQVIKDNYQPVAQKVTVRDGVTDTVKLLLTPNFADITIKTLENAEIFIDNGLKGKGSWQGRLGSGVYSIEARLYRYATAKKDIEVVIGEEQNIDLFPAPIFGSIDIITTPSGAAIKLNGKEQGKTPNTINNLQIGDYELQLTKKGYNDINKPITIAEGKTTELNEALVVSGPAGTITGKAGAEPDIKPNMKLNNDYNKYRKSKNFWLVSGLATLSAGAFSYIQSGKYYSEYQNSTTDADALHQKVKTFDTVYPICFALAGVSAFEFIIKAGKQGKAKKQTLGLTYNETGVGMVYHF